MYTYRNPQAFRLHRVFSSSSLYIFVPPSPTVRSPAPVSLKILTYLMNPYYILPISHGRPSSPKGCLNGTKGLSLFLGSHISFESTLSCECPPTMPGLRHTIIGGPPLAMPTSPLLGSDTQVGERTHSLDALLLPFPALTPQATPLLPWCPPYLTQASHLATQPARLPCSAHFGAILGGEGKRKREISTLQFFVLNCI